MTLLKKHIATLAVATIFIGAGSLAKADEWNKRTTMTIKETIQLPNATLEPGTYVFKLLDSPSDRNIVQVFDKDETHLITTILAIPNYRLTPRGKTVFTFWETPAGQPRAIRAWFYPGDLYGQEFAYPKSASMKIASYAKAAVPTTAAQSNDEMKTAPVTATNEAGETAELDRNSYTKSDDTPAAAPTPAPAPETAPQQMAQAEPAPAPAAEPSPAPMPQSAPTEMPHTASPMPLIGLMGLLSIGAYFAIGRAERVR